AARRVRSPGGAALRTPAADRRVRGASARRRAMIQGTARSDAGAEIAAPGPPSLVRGYTTALGIVGAILLLNAAALGLPWIIAPLPPDTQRLLRLVAEGELIFSALIGVVFVLRVNGSRRALPATEALNVLLMILVPIGTACALYWAVAIRSREEELPRP